MTLVVDIAAITLSDEDRTPIVENVAFTLADGGALGLVGESGSGKSVLALAIIRLLPASMRARGRIVLDGTDLLELDEVALRHVRGARIGMVFQEPMTALNPAMRVGDQIAEGLIWHKRLGRAAARAEALRLLDRVRMPEAARRIDAYPHELSGGQRQRVGLAIALAPSPTLLIADEPTTALDVTVQAEILDLLAGLVAELGMSLILISHDLGVIAGMADDIMVMYAGTAVELGPAAALLKAPRHPYTQGLLAAQPRRRTDAAGRVLRMAAIPGSVPLPGARPAGCRFAPRCPQVRPGCTPVEPEWFRTGGGAVRCILPEARR